MLLLFADVRLAPENGSVARNGNGAGGLSEERSTMRPRRSSPAPDAGAAARSWKGRACHVATASMIGKRAVLSIVSQPARAGAAIRAAAANDIFTDSFLQSGTGMTSSEENRRGAPAFYDGRD